MRSTQPPEVAQQSVFSHTLLHMAELWCYSVEKFERSLSGATNQRVEEMRNCAEAHSMEKLHAQDGTMDLGRTTSSCA
jgi:hypothetical protein